MITGPGDPRMMEKLADAPSFNVMIFQEEDFMNGSILALQLEAERLNKPFIAIIWHQLEIPDDAFLPNVIIVRCGHESVEKMLSRIDDAVSGWLRGQPDR